MWEKNIGSVCYLVAAVGAIAISGCSNSEFSSVTGYVTLDDKPLAKAMVVFVAPGKPMSTARTNLQGEFVMETGSTKGMIPGEYVVTVKAYKRVERNGKRRKTMVTPRKYNRPETSGLKAVIMEGQDSEIQLALYSE